MELQSINVSVIKSPEKGGLDTYNVSTYRVGEGRTISESITLNTPEEVVKEIADILKK